RTRLERSGSSRYAEQTSVRKRAAMSATTFISASAGRPASRAREAICSRVSTWFSAESMVLCGINIPFAVFGFPDCVAGVVESEDNTTREMRGPWRFSPYLFNLRSYAGNTELLSRRTLLLRKPQQVLAG